MGGSRPDLLAPSLQRRSPLGGLEQRRPAQPSGTFLTQSFAFADGKGVRATSTVRDFVDPERIKAGPYRYDKLPPLPPAAATIDENVAVDKAPVAIAQQAQPGAIRLATNTPVPVPLSPIAVPMSAQLEGGSQRLFLVLQDVQATAQPNVLYDVFLDAPTGAPATRPVGIVNFFGAAHDHGGHGSMAGAGRTFSFDVTEALAATAPPLRRCVSSPTDLRSATRVPRSAVSAWSVSRWALLASCR